MKIKQKKFKRLGQRSVVAVKAVVGPGDFVCQNNSKLQPGDILEQIRVPNEIALSANAPFSGGKAGLQSELRKIYDAGEKVIVRVRRGSQLKEGNFIEVHASVVVEEGVMRKKKYHLADVRDRKRFMVFMDSSEEECYSRQDEIRQAFEDGLNSGLAKANLKDCFIPYSWQQKMHAFLPCPNSGMVFSLLLMPFQPNRVSSEFYDLEDTSARAMAWLSSAQASGVPITFVNIQIEPILLQASGSSYFGSSSKDGLPSVVNSGKYTISDWEGTDIHIVRAVRLWFAPAVAELSVNLKPLGSERRLGVGISRTEEGFCYVSSVEDGSPAERAGLKNFYEAASAAQKLLVISRVAGEKVTPWMVSSSASIRCFDTISISERFSVHRHAMQPIQFHVILWDGALDWQLRRSKRNSHGMPDGTADFAPPGVRNSHSNRSSLDSTTSKFDCQPSKQKFEVCSPCYSSINRSNLERSFIRSISSKVCNKDRYSLGDLHLSSDFYQSPDNRMESMSEELSPLWIREKLHSSGVHRSRKSGQGGVHDTPMNKQSNRRKSQASYALESALNAYELAVGELKPPEEEKDFATSF